MKKILFAFLATALFFNACEKPPEPVSVELSVDMAEESTLPSIAKEIPFTITNSSAATATIQWERIGILKPVGFVYTVNDSTITWGKMEVTAGETVSFKLVIDPNGNSGLATGKIKFFDLANEANTTKEFEYSLTTETALFTINPIGSMNGSGKAANETDYYIDVINSTFSPVTVTWEQDSSGQNNTQGWTTAVSMIDSIPNSQAVKTGMIYIPPSDTVRVETKFDPTGNVGSGGVDIIFYVGGQVSVTRLNQVIRHTGTL